MRWPTLAFSSCTLEHTGKYNLLPIVQLLRNLEFLLVLLFSYNLWSKHSAPFFTSPVEHLLPGSSLQPQDPLYPLHHGQVCGSHPPGLGPQADGVQQDGLAEQGQAGGLAEGGVLREDGPRGR